MVTKRKKNQWVRLGDNHEVLPDCQHATLTAAEFTALDEIYEDLQVSSDKLVMDESLCAKFAQEFARRTGKIVPPMLLAATMVTRRKNGELTTLRPKKDRERDLSFRDIDEIDGQAKAAQ